MTIAGCELSRAAPTKDFSSQSICFEFEWVFKSSHFKFSIRALSHVCEASRLKVHPVFSLALHFVVTVSV